MPLPLPYFNNNIDPALPNQIKPCLYYYDEYQTYDLIFISDIRVSLKDNINDYFGFWGNPLFNSWTTLINSEYCLIERFTPFDVTWANQYSEKLYNLMKPFANTQLNSYLLGENHPKANLFNFGNQNIQTQYDFKYASIDLTIPASNQETNIYISWLEYALVEASLPEYNKKYKIIKTRKTPYQITLYFNYLQPCSIVFNCDNEEIVSNLESQLEDCYLYSKFDLVADDLINKINQAYPKINQVLAKVHYSGNIKLSLSSGVITGDFLEIQESDFINIPEEIKNTALIFANNNIWQNQSTSLIDDNELQLFDFYIAKIYYTIGSNFNRISQFFSKSYQYFSLISPLLFSDDLFPSYIYRFEYKYPLLWGHPDLVSIIPSNYFELATHFDYIKTFILTSQWGDFAHYCGLFKSPVVLVNHSTQDINNYQIFKLLIGTGILNETATDVDLIDYNIYDYYFNVSNNNFIDHPISLTWELDFINRNYTLATPITNEEFINLCDQNLHYSNELLTTGENEFMPDSIRLKEIHEALNAQKFAIDDSDPLNQRFANLGYYIERIARVLGINVNPDGSVRSIRQSKFIKQGDEIPAGWSIGQWGRNQGGNTEGQKGGSEDEDRDGLAYEVRSNKFAVDKFSGEATAIEQGGYVLVENLPQLLHIILSDLDKALGWAEAGANVLPNPNGEKPIPYEGLNTLLAEVAFMLSQLSRNITGTHISALKNQGMLMELIAHQGVLTRLKEIEIDIGIEEKAMLVYPSLNGMTEFEQTSLILSNLSLLIGSFLKEEK